MEATGKHTATPWDFDATLNYYAKPVIRRNGQVIATMCDSTTLSKEVMKANAVHLTHCVNTHDALVEALEHIRDAFWSENEPFEERFECLQKYASDVIANMKGETTT